MLDIIPNTEQMIDLVGKSLWEIWSNSHKWNVLSPIYL